MPMLRLSLRRILEIFAYDLDSLLTFQSPLLGLPIHTLKVEYQCHFYGRNVISSDLLLGFVWDRSTIVHAC